VADNDPRLAALHRTTVQFPPTFCNRQFNCARVVGGNPERFQTYVNVPDALSVAVCPSGATTIIRSGSESRTDRMSSRLRMPGNVGSILLNRESSIVL